MDWGFRAWQAKPIAAKGKRVQTAEVQLGDAREVGLVAPRDLAVTIPAGHGAATCRCGSSISGPIKAPIKAGEHIADLSSRPADTPPQTLPLVAESAVGEAGLLRSHRRRLPLAVRHGVSAAARRRGRFISLEGGEGVGKSTQVRAAGRRRCARAGSRWSRRASRAAAPAPRRSARC